MLFGRWFALARSAQFLSTYHTYGDYQYGRLTGYLTVNILVFFLFEV
jgi:hypothetical protein